MKRLALVTSVLIAIGSAATAQDSSYHLWGSKKILDLVWCSALRSVNIRSVLGEDESAIGRRPDGQRASEAERV
jgi:hypothetical protein